MEQPEDQYLKEFKITRFHEAEAVPVDDVVAREEPLEIRLNGSTLVYLMRLPGDDVLLAAGFCLSEGLIADKSQIELIHHCTDAENPTVSGDTGTEPGNLIEIKAKVSADAGRLGTARVVRTGCGGADLEKEVDLESLSVEAASKFDPGTLFEASKMLVEGQEVFRVSGGTHGAGLFDSTGRMLVVKEDVGRHNAVDKVLGHLLMSGETPDDKGLMLSGRLSYEMVLKAARARIPLVCSVSAPTALGVEVGMKTGVTLVGFLRGSSFNVYTRPDRIGGG